MNHSTCSKGHVCSTCAQEEYERIELEIEDKKSELGRKYLFAARRWLESIGLVVLELEFDSYSDLNFYYNYKLSVEGSTIDVEEVEDQLGCPYEYLMLDEQAQLEYARKYEWQEAAWTIGYKYPALCD